MYKVSILVPVYGVERFIERCARSLFEQTYQNLEFVFVNDCTLDRSVEILQKVMADYPDRKDMVRIIDHEKNKGLAASRNTGLDGSVGEFVCCVDSDDWLEMDAIELLVKKQLESEADIVSGNYLVHYENEERLWLSKDCQMKEEMVLNMMQRTWDHFVAGRLVRRSLFVVNGLRWNEGCDAAEDRYMMTLLAYHSNVYSHVNQVVYHYNRSNANAITSIGDRNRCFRNNRQELSNLLSFEQFFKDKEPVYQRESAWCVMEQLEFNLQTALDYSDKDEYYDIVSIIDGRSDADWKLINWKKKGIKKWMIQYYNCMKLVWLRNRAIRYVKKRWKKIITRK